MKKILLSLAVLLSAVVLIQSCSDDDDNNNATQFEEVVAVANRGEGTVSFINAETNEIVSNLNLPGGNPMYVVYVPATDKVYVGDRGNSQVHVINPATHTVETSIDVGNGVFHMWADGNGNQLWVNNDVDNTISVINLQNNTVIETINVDLQPHDVFVTEDGTTAYVSVFSGDAAQPDKVYQYSTSTFMKTDEANVGKDPHLFHLSGTDRLFVPCQSGEVYVLNGSNLDELANNPFEGAHGIFAAPNQSTVFVTNISGNELYAINASDYSQIGSDVASANNTPHNIVVNAAGTKMFVTHSGATANTVSTYTLDGATISEETVVTTGTNPFGLAYYRRAVN